MLATMAGPAAVAPVAVAAPAVAPANQNVIYKHVDESGRVTYANSPIKGGVRVELEPLTVIPATPTGSLASATPAPALAAPAPATPSPAAANPTLATQAAPTMPAAPAANPISTAATPIPVARVVVPTPKTKAATAAPAPAVAPTASSITFPAAPAGGTSATMLGPSPSGFKLATVETMNQVSQQRRAEARRKILEGELETEERLLTGARTQLADEQKNSAGMRAKRATFAATAEAVTAQKPLITAEVRAEIERHFERVRNLQDQVAMHESNLQGLREQLSGLH